MESPEVSLEGLGGLGRGSIRGGLGHLGVKLGRCPEDLGMKEGRSWDGDSAGVLTPHQPHWGLYVCLLQAARGPRGLKGEKGEPAVLEPVSCSVGH